MPRHPLPRAAHRTCINLQFTCSVSLKESHEVSKRRLANYQPTTWSCDFLQSLKNDNADKIYKDKAMELEEEVRCMINSGDMEMLTMLEMIDDIQRLGLGHRFEKDIKRKLDRISSSEQSYVEAEKSLRATALCFRLLRQHGYEISQDIFHGFLDDQGNFMASLHNDIEGMLSLYEASHLACEGEEILNKANKQTSIYLRNHLGNSDSMTAERVSHALEVPLHHKMIMLEARWHIESYGKREDANPKLLQLSKLDFNMMQSVLQRDLQDMSRWWHDLGLKNKLRFSRDRLMECFFWTVGMAFEPEFNSCRKGLTKVTSFITTIDDVYDVYGVLDELEAFTEAVERWDVSAVRNLPDYMKLCFLALFNTVNEMAYDHLKEQGEDAIPCLTKAWADLCKAFLQEAKWSYNNITPSFEEYLENAWRSVSGTVILIHAYFLMGENISKQALDYLVNYDELLRWPSIIFRLSNDLATSSAEIARGETANSISCYMYETGASEAEARKHIEKLIQKAWRNMNKCQIDNETPFARSFVGTAINLARIAQCTYQHGDGHGAPDSRSKNRISSLIIEPISFH
uniref:Isoprene synthase, chloroplastic n=1 Tax=Populus trichocarpa TaxID=3694 RepID=A0A076GAR5_POPTR|nr:terpene synthase [Populus trichocarpa]